MKKLGGSPKGYCCGKIFLAYKCFWKFLHRDCGTMSKLKILMAVLLVNWCHRGFWAPQWRVAQSKPRIPEKKACPSSHPSPCHIPGECAESWTLPIAGKLTFFFHICSALHEIEARPPVLDNSLIKLMSPLDQISSHELMDIRLFRTQPAARRQWDELSPEQPVQLRWNRSFTSNPVSNTELLHFSTLCSPQNRAVPS